MFAAKFAYLYFASKIAYILSIWLYCKSRKIYLPETLSHGTVNTADLNFSSLFIFFIFDNFVLLLCLCQGFILTEISLKSSCPRTGRLYSLIKHLQVKLRSLCKNWNTASFFYKLYFHNEKKLFFNGRKSKYSVFGANYGGNIWICTLESAIICLHKL